MKRFMTSIIAITALLFLTPAAHAQVSIGGQLGSPSGITIKTTTDRNHTLDFLAAWDLDDAFFLNMHVLYPQPIRSYASRQRGDVHFYLGPGAFAGFKQRPAGEEAFFGVSGTFGLSFWLTPVELYVQLTPRLALLEATEGTLGGGVGLRFRL